MLILTCVTMLVLYLMSIHLNARIDASFDLEAGKASLFVAFFGITVFKTTGLIENRTKTEGDLILFYKRKRKSIHIKVDKRSISETISAIKDFNFTLFSNLDAVRIHVKLEYGNGDSFKTFIYLGLIKLILYSVLSVLKSNQRVEVSEQFIPVFNLRTIKTEGYGVFKLSLADIIYGFILSKIRQFKRKLEAFLNKRATKLNAKQSKNTKILKQQKGDII